MKNTRFMEVLFSAVENEDEELANQVASDIENAKANGVVDTDEVTYEDAGDGKVNITDKETGQVTVAEKAEDEDDTYDLYPAEVSKQIEGFVHPEMDGVTPGAQVGAADEDVENHMTGEDVISPNLPDGGLNPEAGVEPSVEPLAQEGPIVSDEEEKEFSVSTDNEVVLKIFSEQEFCERIFAEVIESEQTAKVGDLKFEKLADEENAVVVTSEATGDQAKVVMNDNTMEVTELAQVEASKAFSEEEQFMPLHVVGVDTFNHVIVDAPEYSEESAQELVQRLEEQGVDAVQVFDDEDAARDYAISLLNSLGVESDEDVAEPEQAEFSDHTVYLTEFYSDNSDYMCRLFSECCNDIDASQSAIEDAISNGDEIETDTEIITPVDSKSAVIEDKNNGQITKATIDGEDLELDHISKEKAEELTDHIAVDEDSEVDEDAEDEDDEDDDSNEAMNDEEDERDYSDVDEEVYCNDEQTKFFSESELETMTAYMERLFSDESDSKDIEDAIESGEQIENDTEIITPVDAKTAVIEDKVEGDFNKAELDNNTVNVVPITEEQADDLTENVVVEDKDEDDEKEFSYVNDPVMDKFFTDALGAPVQQSANTAVFTVDENGNPIAPVSAEGDPQVQQEVVEAQATEAVPSVEAVEDKALAAVQSIQAAASEAEAAIMNAKAAPVEGAQEDLKEAQFSEYQPEQENTLMSWLGNNSKYNK